MHCDLTWQRSQNTGNHLDLSVLPEHIQPLNSLSGWTNDVNVFSVEIGKAEFSEISSALSEQELVYARGIRHTQFRNVWASVRSALRLVLSEVTGVSDAKIDINYSTSGKPVLQGNPVHFNVSHSGNRGLIAVSAKYPVGVDLEQIRMRKGLQRLAKRFLHPGEAEYLASLTEQQQVQTFTRLWTAREALVKATGQGIGAGFSRFSVKIIPGSQNTHLEYGIEDPEKILHFPCKVWQLKLEDAKSSAYCAALAVGI